MTLQEIGKKIETTLNDICPGTEVEMGPKEIIVFVTPRNLEKILEAMHRVPSLELVDKVADTESPIIGLCYSY